MTSPSLASLRSLPDPQDSIAALFRNVIIKNCDTTVALAQQVSTTAVDFTKVLDIIDAKVKDACTKLLDSIKANDVDIRGHKTVAGQVQ